jgi:DNA-binding NtrC family response regulator
MDREPTQHGSADTKIDGFCPGVSPNMQAVEELIRELGQSRVPVVLLAERGSGKKTIARRIHEASNSRRVGIFTSLLCSDLSANQLLQVAESPQLEHGSLFLEEIAELPSDAQKELLDILPNLDANSDSYRPRVIAGSAKELDAEVRAGRFREDLYYRISSVCLRLPPLRQRREDISSLTEFFMTKFAHELHRDVPALSAQSQRLFQDYDWPGNVRELKDAVRAIVALGDESVAMGGLRALLTKAHSGNGERVSLKQAARAASREAEKELILRVLTRTRWNRRRAAQELQISYKALLYKLKQIGYDGNDLRTFPEKA